MAHILDGKAHAAVIKARIKERIAGCQSPPSMAVVQVGSDPASTIYIRHKREACNEVGMGFRHVLLDEKITQEAILAEVDALNEDASIHGLLVQQPLPRHLDTEAVVDRINPKKDVDCLHCYNIGLLSEGRSLMPSCTPAGIISLLKAYDIGLQGKHCVIVGRSRIVGKPLAMMMLNKSATVTVCHSRTIGLADICRQADILAVAIGQPKFVTADMVKEGCILVDVGINRISETSRKICGDVDYEGCVSKASYITPVPGGVGPMTVAMLLENCFKAWEQRANS